jgi:hypothetical protein
VLVTSPVYSFESDAFPVLGDEDAATNPGIYGKALAEWMSAKLTEGGAGAKAPYAEDWGWCVEIAGHRIRRVSPAPAKRRRARRRPGACMRSWTWGVLGRFRGGKEAAQRTVDDLSRKLKEILSTAPSISKLLIDEEAP